MATPPGLVEQSQLQVPTAQPSQEHTPSAPMQGTADDPQNSGGLSKDDQTKCMALVRKYKDQWSQNRLLLMERFIENLEMFKGNQFISFGGGTSQFFDSTNWMGWGTQGSGHAQDADDDDLYMYCHNFYQMLCVGFVGALCPQVPKSVWMPEDAEELSDTTTAEAAQTLIDIVEQRNHEQSLLKGQLMYLFSTGSCFRHTRYVVSKDRWGERQEPVFDVTETTIMPARAHCFQCGTDSPPDLTPGACPNCGATLGEDSQFPAETGPMTTQVGEKSVANGMVTQDIYCGLEVDGDPAAMSLRQTPILNVDVEVHVAALRSAYPGMYSQIQASATSELSANGTIDRIARQQVFSQTNGQTSILSDQKPTLSRTWIQPWAFALEDDQAFADRMQKQFPDGMLLVNTGDLFLNAVNASLVKEWTWAGTHERYGLYPPCPGDIVVPFQKKYNDLANILQEGIERGFVGVTLANADLIDTKSMQGKPMLPGVFNLVKPKRTGAPGSMRLQDALYQFEYNLKIEEGMNYCKEQMMSAQMFAMVPPQVYGGQGDPAIETFGGQKQQLNTAMGVLQIYWENLKDEHAQADQLAVECAKDNLTDDMWRVIKDKGSEFTNQYVRLDDLQGSVHAHPDIDQGMPVSAPEFRQRWMDLLQAAESNDLVKQIFRDPVNQEQAAKALGVPGMVVPGEAMRAKVVQIIEQLLKAQPIPKMDPQTLQPVPGPDGQPMLLPSIMPTQDIDDWDVAKATVRQYCQKNWELANDVPQGFQNVLAYYKQLVQMEAAYNVQQAQQQGAALGAGKMASMPPPKPPPQLSPVEQNLLAMARQDGAQGMQDLVNIAQTPALPQGSSLQAQTTAAAKLLDTALKVEQLNLDKTQGQ